MENTREGFKMMLPARLALFGIGLIIAIVGLISPRTGLRLIEIATARIKRNDHYETGKS